jgi:hypothetical protein
MIVVPSPAQSAGTEERHAAAAKPSPVHRELPPRFQKPNARGKQAHHEPERGAAVAASGGGTRGGSEVAEPRTEPSPVDPSPSTEPAPANSLSARVTAAKSAPGVAHKLRATSIPSEAEVLIDGKPIGHTPLFGAEIDISQSHTLTIRKDGYAPYEQPVSVASAWVTRGSENVAALRVQTVLQKLDHNAVAAAAVEPTKTTSNAPVVASSSAALSASSHKLRITSIPTDAEVLLDGKSVGRTPLFGADIDMSHPHRLVLRKEGYALFEQNITTSSEWVVKPSDRSSALLRISALLRRADGALAQNPGAAAP